jgi:hypothetical protein
LGVKSPGLTGRLRPILLGLRAAEGGGIPGVVVKCVDIGRNTSGEGGLPRCKRWTLGIGGIDPLCAEANALSVPPGKYGRKAKTQRN